MKDEEHLKNLTEFWDNLTPQEKKAHSHLNPAKNGAGELRVGQNLELKEEIIAEEYKEANEEEPKVYSKEEMMELVNRLLILFENRYSISLPYLVDCTRLAFGISEAGSQVEVGKKYERDRRSVSEMVLKIRDELDFKSKNAFVRGEKYRQQCRDRHRRTRKDK